MMGYGWGSQWRPLWKTGNWTPKSILQKVERFQGKYMAKIGETRGKVIPQSVFVAYRGLSESCFWRCPWKCWSISECRRPICCRHIVYGPLKRQDTQYHKGNSYYIWKLHFYLRFSYNFTGKYLLILSEWNCSRF